MPGLEVDRLTELIQQCSQQAAAVGANSSGSKRPKLAQYESTFYDRHIQKKTPCERRTIVFIDQSGVSERPHRVRTWAPRGQHVG
jgi:hypothetical protein